MASSSSTMWFDHTATQQEENQAQPTSFLAETTYILVSPKMLLDEGRYICEICHKGLLRMQNLSVHQRTHNIQTTLKTRTRNHPIPKRVFLCPELTCTHHNPPHGLADFSGLRKHYQRKHNMEKNYHCHTCSKAYSAKSDFVAHSKKCCGNKYACRHCNVGFSRKHDLIVHQTYCDGTEHVPEGSDPQTLSMQGMGENNVMQFSLDHKSPMTDPFMGSNLSEIPPPFFPPASTHQNYQEYVYDINYYASLLRGEPQLRNMKNTNLMKHCMNIYGVDKGSYPTSGCYSMFHALNSLIVNPALPNHNLTGTLNTTTTSSNWEGYEQRVIDMGVNN